MSLPTVGIIHAVVAVVLGGATWMVVTWQQNPFREDWLASAVPIEVTHLPAGVVEVGNPGTTRVRLRASQDSWARVKPDDFKASIDLSKQPAGIHAVDVKVDTSRDYDVVDWEPKRVNIRLEPLLQGTVPVQLRITGKLPDGYLVNNQTVTPDQINISGEQDIAQTVTQAAVMLSLDGLRGDVTENDVPVLLDDKGQPVSGVQFSPATVRVSVGIDRQVGVKTVPVRVTTAGQVASGYWLSSLTVTPQTVTITGGPAALGGVDYIDVPPLDLGGAKADVSRATKLTDGNGYSLLSDADVTVKASIQPLRTTEVLPLGIAIQGVPDGLEARISPSTVEVTIGGLVPALSALKPGDVSAVVNAAGLDTGPHTVPIRLNAPASVSLDATNPAAVTVTLAPPATPTPTTTAAPAPPAPSNTPSASPSPAPASRSASASASPAPSATAAPSSSPKSAGAKPEAAGAPAS
jgi:YbbR domain-containing protein